MRYLTLSEILHLYDRIISSSGGTHGVRDFGALESALSQPRLTFNQTDLYPNIVSKATALCFSLIMNHPFVDGNKRIGHAAMETFLILNGYEINATTFLPSWLINQGSIFLWFRFVINIFYKFLNSFFNLGKSFSSGLSFFDFFKYCVYRIYDIEYLRFQLIHFTVKKMDKMMSTINENNLSKLLSKDVDFRLVESHIYSVLSNIEVDSSYEKKFGDIYDWVACNPVYNRLIWGYSTSKFASLAYDALRSSKKGFVLDVGCGSLAFTAKSYILYSERPVVLMDQSLKLLKIAKSRITKLNGKVPENIVFLQGDALQLPFTPKTFRTIISLNLLHVLDDINRLLFGLRNVLANDGKIYFTTLIEGNRIADRYLKVWENAGEVVSRDITQLKAVFGQLGMPIKYDFKGNMAFIYYGGINNQQTIP